MNVPSLFGIYGNTATAVDFSELFLTFIDKAV